MVQNIMDNFNIQGHDACTVATVDGKKGTSQAKVTSNGEKNKPVTLAIVELHRSEGIRQSVS